MGDDFPNRVEDFVGILFCTTRLRSFECYRCKVPGYTLAVRIEQQCAAGVCSLIDGE